MFDSLNQGLVADYTIARDLGKAESFLIACFCSNDFYFVIIASSHVLFSWLL